MLTFRDTNKQIELQGDLLKTITNEYYNVGHANLSDKKILYDFLKEMYLDVKAPSIKSTRNRSLIKVPYNYKKKICILQEKERVCPFSFCDNHP